MRNRLIASLGAFNLRLLRLPYGSTETDREKQNMGHTARDPQNNESHELTFR
jgi:hypothetical protein